jgi:hypothetical protein
MKETRNSISSLLAKVSDWNAVSWIVGLAYPIGVAVLLSGGYILAACLFGVSISWITGKVVSSIEVSEYDSGTVAGLLVISVGLLWCGGSMFWVEYLMNSAKTSSSATVVAPSLAPVQHPPSVPVNKPVRNKINKSSLSGIPTPIPAQDQRRKLVSETRTLASEINGLVTHFRAKRDDLVKEYAKRESLGTPEYYSKHFAPFFRLELQQARDYEVDRYKEEFLDDALSYRHQLRKIATNATEPRGFDESFGDQRFSNPTVMGLEDVAADLNSLADAVQKIITEEASRPLPRVPPALPAP